MKPDITPVEDDKVEAQRIDDVGVSFKNGAIEAEEAEHNMTVLQAVKAYPMACFWAFVMSFCIVGPNSGSMLMPVDHGIV